MSTPNSLGNKNHILSEKVAKSLSLRTDTAQMSNALAALQGSLNVHKQQYSARSIDTKSVRNAIEQDALFQAKEFESQLRKLASEATRLHARVDLVRQSAHSLNVGAYDGECKTIDSSERQIVQDLSKALKKYDDAKFRVNTVSEFLVRFEVSPEDARLLESFDFGDASFNTHENDQIQNSSDKSNIDSTKVEQFLDALDRVYSVRVELSRVFKNGEPGVGTTSAIRMMEVLGSKQVSIFSILILLCYIANISPYCRS